MKVCMVTTSPLSTAGGVENVARNIIKQLRIRGIDAFGVHAYERYSNPVKSALGFREIPRIVDKHKPDIVHTHDNAGYWIAKSGRDFVHTSHGTWINYFDSMPSTARDRIVKRPVISMEKRIVSEAAKNTAVSFFVRDSVREQYKTNKLIEVVHNGVDTKKFFPAERKGTPVALWVGTNPVLKGLDLAISAARLARIKLVVAGVTGKSSKDVRFLGKVKPESMPAIYRNADLLVFPSLYESYPIVPLEAMASGLPVVVSESAHVETMKNGREGYVVGTRNPEDYADRMQKALGRKPKLCRSGRRTARKYDWSRQVKKYIQIYESYR